MAGRGAPPIEFTQEMADRICDRLAMGRSLRSVSEDEDVISLTTILKWLRQNDDFARQYARATDIRSDMMFDDIQHIADAPYKTTSDSDTLEYRRMRIESRKWMIGKMAPKKYGEIKPDDATSSVVNINVRGGLPDT